jgi:predicted O-methyltransferase YrrM
VRDLAYLSRLHREPPPLLLECEQQGTYDGIPIVDRAVGQMLSVLVHCMQANRILEIGTAYGYSTLWMALALPPAGHIWTIDPDAERTQIAASYLERAGKLGAVEIINQPALEVLPTFYQRNLDIVFLVGPHRRRQPAVARHGRRRTVARRQGRREGVTRVQQNVHQPPAT